MDVRPATGAPAPEPQPAAAPEEDPAAGPAPGSGAGPGPGPGDPPGDGSAPVAVLDSRAELSEFLRSRRARLQPEDVGLPSSGRHRRVPGLRREELAQLAGVSVAYYTRLEQGHGRNVSAEVLDAIAQALALTQDERAHLNHLAKPTRGHRRKTPARQQRMRPVLGGLLASLETVPAYVVGGRSQILGWNRMAAALFGDWAELPAQERNWARMIFLTAEARELFLDWRGKAADIVSSLRMDVGRHPDDPELLALIGELSVKSEEFRVLWARHDVKDKSHGEKRLSHPLVGELTLYCESFDLPHDPGQFLVTYHAEPGSPSADSLRLLASWGTDAHRSGSA